MRNTLNDLNNHLFIQLERLNEDNLEGEKLDNEINRSKAVMGIAKNIIDTGSLVLDGQKFMDDRMDNDKKLPRMLEGDD
ncbi:hypothetical protein JNUCC1_03330 [Lentibacillus sp. JNUCC-1]|uniref:hypothetical protein n=1 Tax=Lentibacillus sp. JNUCC-1 TaxID=2654513 RepID=UPI0012E904DA|nr:hypothetical protein [Lentibacillus sp. JNUCC-1]MUV39452.1 hypothetical protein [Lentibacillus sp. JNUCC-1]